MTYHVKTSSVAEGKWKGILRELGMPASFLTGKHGPCPLCGGDDRWRFDNAEGRGTYICGQCGAGDGMSLAMAFTKRSFAEVAAEIDRIVGNEKIEPDAVRQDMSDAQVRAALKEVAAQTVKVTKCDLVDTYLTARGVGELIYPKCLRFAKALRDGDGGVRPCMVATVQAGGVNVSLHRTFLRPDGMAKAEMAAPRKLMPGPLPDGACIALSEFAGGALGIAEGIETAMSASALYDMPVWAAISSGMLAKWIPPEGCDEVVVFGDSDPKFGGQAAAYALGHRLAVRGIPVTVHIPDMGDWNDVLLARGRRPVVAQQNNRGVNL